MDLTASIGSIVGIILVIIFFILGAKVGKRDEGYRWYKACNAKTPIKFKNRLYEVKMADVDEFIDD